MTQRAAKSAGSMPRWGNPMETATTPSATTELSVRDGTAMSNWLESLADFDARAVLVLGPSASTEAHERELVAVYPETYRPAAEVLAVSRAYGAEWRQESSSLVAFKNLAGPQQDSDRIWIDPWLSSGVAALVRVEISLPFDLAFEAFTMLGKTLKDRRDAAEIAWNLMSVWPGVKTDFMVNRFKISERERQILRLLAAGLTAAEVAALEAVNCSARNVTWHLTNIMLKLKADNKAEAIQRACSLGLI